MRFVGIDGCPGGWITVEIDAAAQRAVAVIASAASLAALDATLVMIDIPIGLPESGYRVCDRAARRLLRGAESRIFLGLRRPLLDFRDDYAAANAWAKADGAGLSRQAFHLLPKIAAVDAIVTPETQRRFRESHPELVFARLNGGPALPSKHTGEGISARRAILSRFGFDALDDWLANLRGSGAQVDDLFDACVLALAAQQTSQGHAFRVRTDGVRDARGLRMEIWF